MAMAALGIFNYCRVFIIKVGLARLVVHLSLQLELVGSCCLLVSRVGSGIGRLGCFEGLSD